jgi:uncharacterized protein with HEPN domain
MDEKVLKYLIDIQHSINNINIFLESRPRRYQTFCDDICFRSAVQWEIAVIGEAMNRVLKIAPEISITSARKMVNTRNYIIHGYDSLRSDILWSIVINHIPVLEAEVKALIGQVEA